MDRSESIVELAKALSKFQGAMRSVPKGSENPYFRSKYADLDAVWDMCRKPLSENGLSLVQTTVDVEAKLFLETTLFHVSGEYISSRYPLFPMKQTKETGWVTSDDPQSIGSAITYARRYAMSAMLGVSADEDDDGEGASQKETPTAVKEMPAPRGLCPVHKVPFVERPGGTSKTTGRPYPAFWACPAKVGRGYCQEKPQAQAMPPVAPVEPTEEDLGFGGGVGVVEPEPLFPDAPQSPQEPRNDVPAPVNTHLPDFKTPGAMWEALEKALPGQTSQGIMGALKLDLGAHMTKGGTRRSYYDLAVAHFGKE